MTSATLLIALALPQSLPGSVAFILVVLSIIYALLRLLIKVEPVRRLEIDDGDDDGAPEPDTSAEGYDTLQSGLFEEPRPASFPAGPAAEPPVQQAVTLEAISVHGIYVCVGNTAAQVMKAVRGDKSAALPMIDKDDAGRATRVTREYKIEEQAIQFVFEREAPDTRLLLTDLHIHTA